MARARDRGLASRQRLVGQGLETEFLGALQYSGTIFLIGGTPVLTYSKFIHAIVPDGGPSPGGQILICWANVTGGGAMTATARISRAWSVRQPHRAFHLIAFERRDDPPLVPPFLSRGTLAVEDRRTPCS
jgi:hypothetical protein